MPDSKHCGCLLAAMATGLSTTLLTMEEIMALIDARATKPVRPATYRKAEVAEISNCDTTAAGISLV